MAQQQAERVLKGLFSQKNAIRAAAHPIGVPGLA